LAVVWCLDRHMRSGVPLEFEVARVIATGAPATAPAIGRTIDVEALPPAVIAAHRARQVNLADPAVTVEVVRLNSVLGVRGR
jgi:hypothetical protein